MLSLPCTAYDRILLCLFLVFLTLFWAFLSFQIHPNSKWVTDISYIHTEQGVLYLSMIRDLYDNSIVAYKTAAQQTVNLVLDTIRLAMKKEKVAGGVAPPAANL